MTKAIIVCVFDIVTLNLIGTARPKSIQIRQLLPFENMLSKMSSSPSNLTKLQASQTYPKDDHLVRNRTLHSISLLDYYLNANQPSLTMQPLRLRSGFHSELSCQTNGSRPAAKIDWFLQDYQTNVERNITQLRLVELNYNMVYIDTITTKRLLTLYVIYFTVLHSLMAIIL